MSDSLLTEVTVSINGATVNVAPGTTILEAAGVAGVEIPTLCWASNLTPARSSNPHGERTDRREPQNGP